MEDDEERRWTRRWYRHLYSRRAAARTLKIAGTKRRRGAAARKLLRRSRPHPRHRHRLRRRHHAATLRDAMVCNGPSRMPRAGTIRGVNGKREREYVRALPGDRVSSHCFVQWPVHSRFLWYIFIYTYACICTYPYISKHNVCTHTQTHIGINSMLYTQRAAHNRCISFVRWARPLSLDRPREAERSSAVPLGTGDCRLRSEQRAYTLLDWHRHRCVLRNLRLPGDFPIGSTDPTFVGDFFVSHARPEPYSPERGNDLVEKHLHDKDSWIPIYE